MTIYMHGVLVRAVQETVQDKLVVHQTAAQSKQLLAEQIAEEVAAVLAIRLLIVQAQVAQVLL
jgi:hypothetical protein